MGVRRATKFLEFESIPILLKAGFFSKVVCEVEDTENRTNEKNNGKLKFLSNLKNIKILCRKK